MDLKKFREKRNLNQKAMADKIGVSASYYYKVESGMRNPSYEFMVKLKAAFPQISIDKMFFGK